MGKIVDVINFFEVKDLVDSMVLEFGYIDVMINNVGIMLFFFYVDYEVVFDVWSWCIDINIKGVLNGFIVVYD